MTHAIKMKMCSGAMARQPPPASELFPSTFAISIWGLKGVVRGDGSAQERAGQMQSEWDTKAG